MHKGKDKTTLSSTTLLLKSSGAVSSHVSKSNTGMSNVCRTLLELQLYYKRQKFNRIFRAFTRSSDLGEPPTSHQPQCTIHRVILIFIELQACWYYMRLEIEMAKNCYRANIGIPVDRAIVPNAQQDFIESQRVFSKNISKKPTFWIFQHLECL